MLFRSRRRRAGQGLRRRARRGDGDGRGRGDGAGEAGDAARRGATGRGPKMAHAATRRRPTTAQAATGTRPAAARGDGDGERATTGSGRRRRRRTAWGRRSGANGSGWRNFHKCYLIYPEQWSRFVLRPGTNAPFSPGWCDEPGPKANFQQPKGREAKAIGPGCWHQPGLKGALVTVRGTNRDHCPPLVQVGATNRDQWPSLPALSAAENWPLVPGRTNRD